jgi:hypothetical protein
MLGTVSHRYHLARPPTASVSRFTKTYTLLTSEIHCAFALFAKIATPLLTQSLSRCAQANRHRPAREPAAAAAASGPSKCSSLSMVCNCLPSADQSASLNWLEVVLLEVVGDLVSECGSLPVGSAEVDPAPYSGVDDFVERIREPLKAPGGTGFVAECAEANLVGAEKVLERVNDCTA